jgi:hypothetical protein
MRRLLTVAAVLLALLLPAPARAQWEVTDPASIAQLVDLIRKIQDTIRLYQESQRTLDRMRQGLRGLEKYRLPGIPIGTHNVTKYPWAADILAGMNSGGDPDGNGWQRTVHKLQIPADVFAHLPADLRRGLAASGATIELLDSTAIMGQWTTGQTRVYSERLQERIDRLTEDTITGVHEPTANLDRLAIAATLRSRQQMNATQLQSAIVNQQIATAKSRRDAEVSLINAQINALRQPPDNSLDGTAGILANWSLP